MPPDLLSLPVEILLLVAENLHNDRDFLSFARACSFTRDMINGFSHSIWRPRFERNFDPCEVNTVTSLKQEYIRRRFHLRKGLTFVFGDTVPERGSVQVLKRLILESCGQADVEDVRLFTSRNQYQICRFAVSTSWLNGFLSVPMNYNSIRQPVRLYRLVMLVLSYMNLRILSRCHRFGLSQKAVYETASAAPVFSGVNRSFVNETLLLHVVNFFKYHVTTPSEATLFPYYKDLEEFYRPRPWQGKLSFSEDPRMVGPSLRGSTARLSPSQLVTLRGYPEGHQSYVDIFETGKAGGFQILELQEQPRDTLAGALYRDWLEVLLLNVPTSADDIPLLRQVSSYIPFIGTGLDADEKFHVEGLIHHISPQAGIPGWQRFVMIKYYRDPHGFPIEAPLYGYEGCILPGSQMILGRWWHAIGPELDAGESGPFIFWNVPDNDDVYLAFSRRDDPGSGPNDGDQGGDQPVQGSVGNATESEHANGGNDVDAEQTAGQENGN